MEGDKKGEKREKTWQMLLLNSPFFPFPFPCSKKVTTNESDTVFSFVMQSSSAMRYTVVIIFVLTIF